MITDDIKVIETIDLTPTWSQILPVWLNLYQAALQGRTKDPDTILCNAEIEFNRMAEAADKWNAHCKELQA